MSRQKKSESRHKSGVLTLFWLLLLFAHRWFLCGFPELMINSLDVLLTRWWRLYRKEVRHISTWELNVWWALFKRAINSSKNEKFFMSKIYVDVLMTSLSYSPKSSLTIHLGFWLWLWRVFYCFTLTFRWEGKVLSKKNVWTSFCLVEVARFDDDGGNNATIR